MTCDRIGCRNIMCHTLISELDAYICTECQREFEDYLESLGSTTLPRGEMMKELKHFMRTEKSEYAKGEDISVDDFFAEYTREY